MNRLWVLRAVLLAIATSIPLRIANEAAAKPTDLFKRTRSVFEQAGYQVKIAQIGTGDARTPILLARSAACSQAVQVSALTIAAKIDDDVSAEGGRAPIFAFGEWSGPKVSRLRLVLEVMRLRIHYAISFGRAPWVSPMLLKMEDPSLCLMIASPELAEIWRG